AIFANAISYFQGRSAGGLIESCVVNLQVNPERIIDEKCLVHLRSNPDIAQDKHLVLGWSFRKLLDKSRKDGRAHGELILSEIRWNDGLTNHSDVPAVEIFHHQIQLVAHVALYAEQFLIKGTFGKTAVKFLGRVREADLVVELRDDSIREAGNDTVDADPGDMTPVLFLKGQVPVAKLQRHGDDHLVVVKLEIVVANLHRERIVAQVDFNDLLQVGELDGSRLLDLEIGLIAAKWVVLGPVVDPRIFFAIIGNKIRAVGLGPQ